MAKQRRARVEARLAKARTTQRTAGEDVATTPLAQPHVRKLKKRVTFLQRASARCRCRWRDGVDSGPPAAGVKDSALSARAAVFKRKRISKGATLSSLGALVRPLHLHKRR